MEYRRNSAAALIILAGVAFVVDPLPLAAQTASATSPSLLDMATGTQAPEGRMLVEADSLVYDIDEDRVSAIGGVVIYYGSYTLIAERVDVMRESQRVTATGNVQITDAAGNVVRGSSVDLTDDLRDGVIEALEIVTEQRVAFTAARAQRTGGDVTVFEEGAYLPCVDCDGVAGRKPIWQIKARKITHRQGDRTLTFEDAKFEFLGVPIAWVPSLTQPDPTVRRKSGFLFPQVSYNDQRGLGGGIPYFYALAPDMDVTVTPTGYSRQGVLMDVEWRQRLISGAYTIRATGIRQERPEAFDDTSGDREHRGSLETSGEFEINDRWSWGWDIAVASDASYFDDYDIGNGDEDRVNDIHITGVDGRNRFEGHLYGFFVQEESSSLASDPAQTKDLQDKQPYVHPSIDHQIYVEDVGGGEFSLNSNFTSLSRAKDDIFEFDADNDGLWGPKDPDGEDTRLRGAAGNFTRTSIDALWRRRLVDGIGGVFTPFTYFRGDLLFSAPVNPGEVGLNNQDFGARAMPAVGLEYSYPILVAAPQIGSSVIEPIAQLIVRPNEQETGNFPNEDAQSLVFDAASLFEYDKFSGYDRLEGGTRLNVGVRYTGQFVNGMSLTGLAGQSIHLAGENPFATVTPYDTGADSGLDSDPSDYVTALSLNTARGLILNGAMRFDQTDFALNRTEAQAIALAGPLTTSVTYAFIAAQPDLGLDEDRSEIQTAASLRMAEHWRVFGATRFDLEDENFVRNAVGLAYDDEAFSVSLSYSEDKTSAIGDPTDKTIYLRLGFRTLGDTNGSYSVD